MAKKQVRLGGRERQIMDAVFALGEASVAQVREQLPDSPSYSSVRTMMGLLEQKGLLKRRVDGIRHLYRPTRSSVQERKSALAHLVSTFFGGSVSTALATFVDESAARLSEEDLDRLQAAIDKARKGEAK